MANNVFLGGASSVAQVDGYTPATVQVNDIFTLTATGADGSTAAVNFTATVATVANVTAGLVAAWNASTNALHTPITASDLTTSLRLTADVAGVPFLVAATTTDGGGANTQTLTKATVTANSHSEDWGTAANWATGAVPVSTDSVQLNDRAANNITRGLYWQNAIALALLDIRESFTKLLGAVGGTKLRIGATNVLIGDQAADGSTYGGSALLNLYITGATTIRVVSTSDAGTSAQPPLQIVTDNNASDVLIESGVVGVGTDVFGETVTVNDIQVQDGRVEIGSGVSFSGSTPKLIQDGGECVARGTLGTVEVNGGTLTTEGTGTVAAITVGNEDGGTLVSNSSGTIAALTVQGAGLADFSQSSVARTVSAATIDGVNASIDADNGKPLSITWTAGIDLVDGARARQFDGGSEINLAITAA